MRPILIAVCLLLLSSAPAAMASSAPEGAGATVSTYIPLPTLTASLVRGNGRRGVLTVQAGLDVPDARLRERAAASQPRLRDAYVNVLSAYASSMPGLGPPDPDAIASGLQRATDQVLARPGARLLLGTIMVN